MKDNMRYVMGGAALGAILGAVVGLVASRRMGEEVDAQGNALVAQPLGTGDVLKLGAAVVAVVRQVMELG
jgi:hypothetical protein